MSTVSCDFETECILEKDQGGDEDWVRLAASRLQDMRDHTFFSGNNTPASKVHGANMGPIWGRQVPGGPHVGPMNFAIWDKFLCAVGWVRAI